MDRFELFWRAPEITEEQFPYIPKIFNSQTANVLTLALLPLRVLTRGRVFLGGRNFNTFQFRGTDDGKGWEPLV